MVAPDRRAGRRQRAAPAGEAPVRRHREDRRHRARHGDDPRSRPAHLFQGGGRRPGLRRLRAEPDRRGLPATCRTISSSSSSTTTGTISSSTSTAAIARIPALETAGIKQMINGPESLHARRQLHPRRGAGGARTSSSAPASTPSASPRPAAPAGCSPTGWRRGEQPMDLWVVDIRRFSDLHRDRDWTRERTLEAYGKHYTVAFPLEEYESGRPRIVSPLYERLKARRAVFGSKLGWERANWFAPRRRRAARHLFLRPRQLVRRASARSTGAVREAVGALRPVVLRQVRDDAARDAAEALSWIAANDVDQAAGPAHLHADAQLARRHRVRPDRRAARRGPLLHRHRHRLPHPRLRLDRQNIPAGLDATLTDVTEECGTLSLMGPRARDVLAAVTDADVSNAAFPFGHVREIAIAGVDGRARCASPMSASSAGSCTSRSARPATSSTR